MVLSVGLTLATLALPLPQGGEAGSQPPPPLLSPAEQKSLNKKLADYIEADQEHEQAPDNRKDRTGKKKNQAKDAFVKEWESRCDKLKVDLLKSVTDLQAIFANVLPYERRSGQGLMKREEAKTTLGQPIDKEYGLFVPKGYKYEAPARTVIMVPGLDDAGGWVECRDWFAATWGNAAANKPALLEDTIFHAVQVQKGLELDPAVDFTRQAADDSHEVACIAQVLVPFNETFKNYNVDRDRVLLDCGRGSSSFGLRFATLFPHRLCGLVLRDAPEADDIRLGSLNGLPVLIVADGKTAAAAAKLEQRINALHANSCTVLKAEDAYPYPASSAAIEKWLAERKRELFLGKVVIEPNNPRIAENYWVNITKMEAIGGVPLAKRPRLEVTADRAQNRLTIKAEGVEEFTVLLNDRLVDLDDPKGVTLIINDKALTIGRGRDRQALIDLVLRKQDTGWLFPVSLGLTVPRPEPKTGDDGNTAGK